MPQSFDSLANAREHDLTLVPGTLVGHVTHAAGGTGCTVVRFTGDVVCGVDVRGGAPGTRELALLDPANTVSRVQAILLAGGSALGLRAADGVVAELRAAGRGFATDCGPIPIVPAAVIFDLGVGSPDAGPSAADGAAAWRDASAQPFERGNVGAGTGASVGKARGRGRATAGGLGSAGLRLDCGLAIGALAVVNAFGDVRDARSGRILAGARDDEDRPLDTSAWLASGSGALEGFGANTTLAVIATDARLDPGAAQRVARMAQAGLARAVTPAHTPLDGDVVFAASTGAREADVTRVGALAAELLALAIADAVLRASGRPELPTAGALGWWNGAR